MALTADKIAALAAQAAAEGKDLTKAGSGGDFEIAAEGVARLRFVSYVETGVHTTRSAAFGDKTKARAELTFELSGPKHPPREGEGGVKYPLKLVIKEPIGTHKKNGYMKLFAILNEASGGEATNFPQLLGKAFLGNVSHRTFKKADGTEGKVAQLKKDGVYNIRSTTFENPADGSMVTVTVDEPITPLRLFLWDYADLEQFDELYVEGSYDDGGTKNKLQQAIVTAENFVGSPIHAALLAGGRDIPTFDKEEPEPEDDDAPAKAEKAPSVAAKPVPAPTPAKPAAKPSTARAAKPTAKPAAKPEAEVDPLEAAFG